MAKVARRGDSADILAKYLPGVKNFRNQQEAWILRGERQEQHRGQLRWVSSERSLLWNSGGSQQPVDGARGRVSAVRPINERNSSAGRAGREAPTLPAMTLVVESKVQRGNIQRLRAFRVPCWVLHRDMSQREYN